MTTLNPVPPLVDPIRLLREAREMEEQLAEIGVEVVIDPFSGYVQWKYKKLSQKVESKKGGE